jgi:hypothetical protein
MRSTAFGWAALSVLAAGCGPRGTAAHPPVAGLCSARLPGTEPAFTEAPAVQAPESHIAVDVAIDTHRLGRELSRHVPVVLAQAKDQNVGAPGQATYVVRRGSFHFGVRGNDLLVETPIRAHIAVCKPIGPFCPEYGHCSPELVSTVRLPLALDRDYTLGRSRVGVSVTRGCVLQPIGVDVTPQLRDMARRQSGGIQRRIDRSVPSLRPEAEAAWQLLDLPIALGSTLCARVTPSRLVQSKPALSHDTLSTRLAVFGRLGVEEPCSEQHAGKHRPLPPPELDDQAPSDVRLDVPIHMDWNDVSADLSRSLAGAGEPRITGARARGAEVDGQGVVALAVTLDGAVCGNVWLVGQPWYDAQASRVRLRNVRYAPGQPDNVAERAGSALPARVEQLAQIALPIDLALGPRSLSGLVESLTKKRPEGVDVKVEVQPAEVDSVLVDPGALVPVASLRGTVRVLVQ